MKRTIKFRFWSKILKKFVIPQDTIFVGALRDKKMVVQQYTGIQDKNGLFIFEGDFLSGENNKGKFVQMMPHGVWALAKAKRAKTWYQIYCSINKIYQAVAFEEVIGNVYENPELLNPLV